MREPLSIVALMQGLQRLAETRGERIKRIALPVERPVCSLGPTPSVAVVDYSLGFDWDSGTLFLTPEQALTPLTADELEEIKRCRREGQSWAIYKARERWDMEKDALVETVNKLRTALLQRGMSTDELAELAGPAPSTRPRRRKAQP